MWPFSIIQTRDGANVATKPDLSGQKFPTQFEHFVECILSGSETISPARHGLEVLKMLDAIYRSSETGRAVAIRGEPA